MTLLFGVKIGFSGEKKALPVGFSGKARYLRLLCASVIRNGCPVAAGIENDKDFGLFLLQAFVLAQGVEYPFAEQFRAIGVDAEAEKYDRFQIIIGNDAFVLFLGYGHVAVIKQAGFEDGAHIGVYCLHEHSEQTGKFVLGHPYVAVLYLYTDDGLFILVFQTGDGDVSSIFHKALFFKWCDNIMICLFIQRFAPYLFAYF
jgi:hypothetical protein